MDSHVYLGAPRATMIDARYGYLLFLGRTAESREAAASKLGLPLADFVGGFLHSREFAEHVLHPVMRGEWTALGRFDGRPSPRLCAWAACRLAASSVARSRIESAASWTSLWTELTEEPTLQNSFDIVWPPYVLAGFRQGLRLRTGGLGAGSSPDHPRPPPPGDLQAAALARFGSTPKGLSVTLKGPLVSLIAMVPKASDDLGALVESARAQTYRRWELILLDRGGRSSGALLDGLRVLDPCIRLLDLEAGTPNRTALLAAMDVVRGSYAMVLDDYDRLSFDALERLVQAITIHDRPHAAFGDRVWLSADGAAERFDPLPAWSPVDSPSRLRPDCITWRADVLAQMLAAAPDDSDPIPAAAIAKRASKLRVAHVETYVHGRIAPITEAKSSRTALSDPFRPKLSIIVTGADNGVPALSRTVRRLLHMRGCRDAELLVVTPHALMGPLARAMGLRGPKFLECDATTSQAQRRDRALDGASGEVLVFLDVDVSPREPAWLQRLLDSMGAPDIAAAGAVVLDANKPSPSMKSEEPDLVGPALDGLRAALGPREVSLLDPRAFAVRRSVMEALGGHDQLANPNWAPVDLLMRMHRSGMRLVQADVVMQANTPQPNLRGAAASSFLRAWGHRLCHDPFYTPAMRSVFGPSRDTPLNIHLSTRTPQPSSMSCFVWTDLSAPYTDTMLNEIETSVERGEFVVAGGVRDGSLRTRLTDLGAMVLVSTSIQRYSPWWSEFAASFDRTLDFAKPATRVVAPSERRLAHVG